MKFEIVGHGIKSITRNSPFLFWIFILIYGTFSSCDRDLISIIHGEKHFIFRGRWHLWLVVILHLSDLFKCFPSVVWIYLPLAAYISVYTKIYIFIFVPIYEAKINFSISRLNIGIYLHFHWINLEMILTSLLRIFHHFVFHMETYMWQYTYIKHS
jgi:hypothetical protein